ncbi:conserved protein of unknown function [Ectopseudomonas oleovorans]|uniref:Uncharacterized protein n=1 Tax=Ectopseudomonas oleovorans TaxID=301 RepID=A0A653B1M0_ECTOL|nr:conserved protein of unknown function [Pseudomonas oleovorans]
MRTRVPVRSGRTVGADSPGWAMPVGLIVRAVKLRESLRPWRRNKIAKIAYKLIDCAIYS